MDRLELLVEVIRAIQGFGPSGATKAAIQEKLKSKGVALSIAELSTALVELSQETGARSGHVVVLPARRPEVRRARDGEFTLEECRKVVAIWERVRTELHERNPWIIALAATMGRKRRGVEAQLVMCRHIERSRDGAGYSWTNASEALRTAYVEAFGPPSDAGGETVKEKARKGGREQVRAGKSQAAGAESFQWLTTRAFGGEDVAVAPGTESQERWPEIGGPPGAEQLVDGLAAHVTSGRGTTEWVFLLGGAGNGKSSLARRLARAVGMRPQHREIAKRYYKFEPKGGTQLQILNDATIATRADYKDDTRRALFRDLSGFLKAPSPPCLLANVNKGILIEELRATSELDGKPGSEARDLIKWLANGAGTSGGGATADEDGGYYRSTTLKAGRRTIRVRALSVDVASLLEPAPAGGDHEGDANLQAPLRTIADFDHGTDERRTDTLGGQLLAALLENLHPVADARPERCPLRCNVGSLSQEVPQGHFLNLLRAAEIAGGQLLTFRDFWGSVVLGLLGPRDLFRGRRGKAIAPEVAIDGLFNKLDSEGDPLERFRLVAALAAHRTHVALLWQGPSTGAGVGAPGDFPISEPLAIIDGAADYIGIWSNKLDEALEELAVGGCPSAILEGEFGLGPAWTPFDELVEESIVAAHDATTSDTQRRHIRSWYARYLARFGTVFLGKFGHRDVIAEWCRIRDSGKLVGLAGDGLRRLLITPDPDEGPLRLPALAPTTSPVRPVEGLRAADSIVLRIPAESYESAVAIRDGRIWVKVIHEPRDAVVAEVPLDFRLLREALVAGQGSGFTEQGADLAPRVERARTAIVGQLLAQVAGQGKVRFIHDGTES